jgi:hypothetical protein
MDGREFWFEMRKAGVFFRPLHGRHWAEISFTAVRDLHLQQFPLPGI